MFQKVKLDGNRMTTLKRNKNFEQWDQAKAEIFGMSDLPEKNAEDEVDPLIERLRSFNIQVGIEVRGCLNNSYILWTYGSQK